MVDAIHARNVGALIIRIGCSGFHSTKQGFYNGTHPMVDAIHARNVGALISRIGCSGFLIIVIV